MHMRRRNAGFSLVEMLMVVAILMIMASVAIIRMRQSITLLDADKAANQVAAELRYARQVALDDRRNVLVEFIGANEIKVTRQDTPMPTVLYDGILPSGFRFGLPNAIGDTPDAYGNSAPVTFNMQTSGVFRGDGIFTDAAGIVVNGSVFTISGDNSSSRAVTLTGATGRIKTYTTAGNSWVTR
jgi:prepilin-type N-terminal cleavage/methylation domain-containing protein